MVTFLGTKQELAELFNMIRSPQNNLLDRLVDDRTYVIESTRDGVLEVIRELQTKTPANSKTGRPKKYNDASRSKKRQQRLAS